VYDCLQICHNQFYCVNVYESVSVSLQACGKYFRECYNFTKSEGLCL